jgi:hypothetical protein
MQSDNQFKPGDLVVCTAGEPNFRGLQEFIAYHDTTYAYIQVLNGSPWHACCVYVLTKYLRHLK